jgi:predicted nucleotidyltransferase
MKIFFDSPDHKFYIREIARMTKLSAPGVIKIIKKLKKEGLLLSKKGMVVENVYASMNKKFIIIKQCYNIFHLHDCGIVDFLKTAYEPEAIVSFGSYSRGEDTSQSSIGIAILTKKNRSVDCAKFEKRLRRKIDIHLLQPKRIKNEFLNMLADGVVIYGHLKVIE